MDNIQDYGTKRVSDNPNLFWQAGKPLEYDLYSTYKDISVVHS